MTITSRDFGDWVVPRLPTFFSLFSCFCGREKVEGGGTDPGSRSGLAPGSQDPPKGAQRRGTTLCAQNNSMQAGRLASLDPGCHLFLYISRAIFPLSSFKISDSKISAFYRMFWALPSELQFRGQFGSFLTQNAGIDAARRAASIAAFSASHEPWKKSRSFLLGA